MVVRKILSFIVAGVSFGLSFLVVSDQFAGKVETGPGAELRVNAQRSSAVMLAFGDVNLGRMVGQKILHDQIDFPFEQLSLRANSIDIVFANLECQLSEQDGETQDPDHNMIFTGPPNGAHALADFGITHVSTANNHAYDYGKGALFETLDHLDDAGIAHVGTTKSPANLYEPLIFERKGIRFAIFAVTGLMNFKNGWHDYVAADDTSRLFPAVREAAGTADIVIVSFHGGEEYGDGPDERVKQFAEECAHQGAKIFLGHHPHVAYGIVKENDGYIFYSLGNFVFYQPQFFWTQVSFAAEITFEKRDGIARVSSVNCIPLSVGYQPSILSDSDALLRLERRIAALSNIRVTWTKKEYLR